MAFILLTAFVAPGVARSRRGLNQVTTEVMPNGQQSPGPSEKPVDNLWAPEVQDAQSSLDTGRLIITLKTEGEASGQGVDSMQVAALASISSLANVKNVEKLSTRAGIHRVTLMDPQDARRTMRQLRRNDRVQTVEYDELLHISDFTPNDPYFENDSLWGMKQINAPAAWDVNTGSSDVVVCVIDTGVDYNHEDLSANMWRNPGEIGVDASGNDKATNGIDDDGNGIVDDVHGLNAIDMSGDPMDDNAHGTHCAGTIGGAGNNGIGVVGVTHSVSIMACKFLDSRGSGYTSDAIACLEYALDKGATLTSNSWGGGSSSAAMSSLIDLAESRGQLFVAAAGNSASNNDLRPSYPANYPQDIVVSVASTTESDLMSSFSCYGPTTVDLGAPGSNIYSTIPGNGYSSFSGTSMATPHVAGALALMYSANSELSAAEAKRIIMNTGSALPALSGQTVSGKRLDVAAALAAMGSPPPTSPQQVSPVQQFAAAEFDLSSSSITFTAPTYTPCFTSGVTALPEDTSGSMPLDMGDDDSTLITFTEGFSFPYFGTTYSSAHVGSNGFVTFGSGDTTYVPTLDAHFNQPRISALFNDLSPTIGTVSWKQLQDRVVITYTAVPHYGRPDTSTFQVVLKADGSITLAYLNVYGGSDKLVGLSGGSKPDEWTASDLSASATCPTLPSPPTSPPATTPTPTSAPTLAPTSAPTPAPTNMPPVATPPPRDETTLECPAPGELKIQHLSSSILVTCVLPAI